MDKCKHGFDHACLICGFTHIDGKKVWFDWAWQEQQKRIDELQSRLDSANKIVVDNLFYVSQNHRESFKPLLMTMQRSFNELKQALKGDEA